MLAMVGANETTGWIFVCVCVFVYALSASTVCERNTWKTVEQQPQRRVEQLNRKNTHAQHAAMRSFPSNLFNHMVFVYSSLLSGERDACQCGRDEFYFCFDLTMICDCVSFVSWPKVGKGKLSKQNGHERISRKINFVECPLSLSVLRHGEPFLVNFLLGSACIKFFTLSALNVFAREGDVYWKTIYAHDSMFSDNTILLCVYIYTIVLYMHVARHILQSAVCFSCSCG